MNVSLNTNFSASKPAFKGFYVQEDDMSDKQKNISCDIIDNISYSEEYQVADRQNVDVYIVPNEDDDNSVKVRYMDLDSDNYVRKNDEIYETVTNPFEKIVEAGDKIIGQLGQIIGGFVERPEIDSMQIVEGRTDLAKVRPELYEGMNKIDEMI